MTEVYRFPKPCYMCTWRHIEFGCGLHYKPKKDGTCEAFEHEDSIVENQHPEEMNKVRGKKGFEKMTKKLPDCLTCTFRTYCRTMAHNCPILWLIDNIEKVKKVAEK